MIAEAPTTKRCTKCNEDLPLTGFYRDSRLISGLTSRCKKCLYAKHKKWAASNREKRNATHKKWAQKSKEYLAEYGKKYYSANKITLLEKDKKRRVENAEEIKKCRAARYLASRDVVITRVKEYTKRRRKADPIFKAKLNLRSRLGEVMRGKRKAATTMELVGCSLPELKAHLESLFQPGMSWDNYGKWHIDHIMPCASFDLLDPEQQRECFHYTNLQPLWASDNLRKHDKLPEEWAAQRGEQ